MKLLIAVAFGIAGACLLAPSAANAQATRTWVSGTGDDANPCSRTAPCKTFAGAISKTAPAGEINCIDTGGFGALTITKSIAIKCDNTEAGVLVSGTNGFVVSAASTDVVWISGLDFEGLGPTALSLNGIKILSAGVVTVANCVIRGFGSTNGTDGNGIFVNNSGAVKVNVYDTYIADNATVGLEVKPVPVAGAAASATVEALRVRSSNAAVGLRANATGGATNINFSIDDSAAVANTSGIVSVGGSTTNTQIIVRNSTVSNNSSFGLNANNATIRVGTSIISGNGTATNQVGTGQVLSYGTNEINGNGVDTVPTLIPGGLH